MPDMQLMEAKLKQLKAKKDAEEARKKAKAAALNNPNRAAAAMEAARAVQEREQHAANLLPQAPARRDNGPPVRYVDSKDSNAPVPMPAMAHPPRPANARASVDSSAHGCVRTCAAVAPSPCIALRLRICRARWTARAHVLLCLSTSALHRCMPRQRSLPKGV